MSVTTRQTMAEPKPQEAVSPPIRKLWRAPSSGNVPPLNNGDRLTRAEFHRRYAARPEIKKAELIEGIVHMPSPVHFSSHGQPHAAIIGWLAVYVAVTPGTQLGDNVTVFLDMDNEVQPDALLRLDTALGGRSRITDDDYLEGPPELIVEVAASSASYDMHSKLNVYRRSGVQEYLVLQAYEQRTDWFVLEEGEYRRLEPGEDGVLRSRVFPGLWLKPVALWAGDLVQVLAVLQEGLASPEHQAFVESMQARLEQVGK